MSINLASVTSLSTDLLTEIHETLQRMIDGVPTHISKVSHVSTCRRTTCFSYMMNVQIYHTAPIGACRLRTLVKLRPVVLQLLPERSPRNCCTLIFQILSAQIASSEKAQRLLRYNSQSQQVKLSSLTPAVSRARSLARALALFLAKKML